MNTNDTIRAERPKCRNPFCPMCYPDVYQKMKALLSIPKPKHQLGIKSVKSWVGEDGYIHMDILMHANNHDCQPMECEVHNAVLPFHCNNLVISQGQDSTVDGICLSERYSYLHLDSEQMRLYPDERGALFTVKELKNKTDILEDESC